MQTKFDQSNKTPSLSSHMKKKYFNAFFLIFLLLLNRGYDEIRDG